MFDHNEAMLIGGGYMWLLWILIIIALFFVIKIISDSGSATPPDDKIGEDPMSILMKRYVSGEIDSEEYERIKKTIEKS